MHEKCSHAWPALVLHAGRAEKCQVLMLQQTRLPCTNKNPSENQSKGIQELTPATNLERQRKTRASVVLWMCKSSRREHRWNGPKDLWQGAILNAAEKGKKSPGTEMTSHINITFNGVC